MLPRKKMKITSLGNAISSVLIRKWKMLISLKNKKEETKKKFAKRSLGQRSRGIMNRITKSTQQSNRTKMGDTGGLEN